MIVSSSTVSSTTGGLFTRKWAIARRDQTTECPALSSAASGRWPWPEPSARLGPPTVARCLVPARSAFPDVLNALGLLGTGVEVGVKQGEFSEEILAGWHGRRLFSVDAWSAALDPTGAPLIDEAGLDHLHEETCHRSARFGDRSEVWRMSSVEAAERCAGQPRLRLHRCEPRLRSVGLDLDAWFDPRTQRAACSPGTTTTTARATTTSTGSRAPWTRCALGGACAFDRTLFDAPETTWMIRMPCA